MDAASIYAMSPGDVKWGVAFIIFLAAVFVWGTVTSFLKFRRTGEKKELLGVFFCGAFAIGMIPADMVLRSHTSAAILLDDVGVSVLRRPGCEDRIIAYKNMRAHEVTTLTRLGGIGKVSGYSDGTERVGWFRMHRNNQKILACSKGDKVLLVQGGDGEVFVLAPPDLQTFLDDFHKRANAAGR